MSSHANRQKCYRARQRDGQAILGLRCNYFALVEALLRSGRITETEALDRGQVKLAAEEVLADWVARWKA